jgi:hypothetical protein
MDRLTITSAGEFEAPDRVSCDIAMSGMGFSFPWKLIVIPPDAWVNIMGQGWTPTTASEVEGDLRQFCPGSSLFWEGFLPLDLTGIPGQTASKNGVMAVRLSLMGRVDSLPFIGAIPPDATVNTFDIWVAQSGGWLVALQYDATETADEGGTVEDRMQVNVTRPNDPTIHVVPPM